MATNNNPLLNCPPLRFPDFSDPWQKTTLGEVAEIKKGSGISKDQLSLQGHPCILYGELYTTYLSEVIREIRSHTEIDLSTLTMSQAGDVIIPSSGETAIDIAVARCIPVNNVALGGDLNIIRSSTTDGRFLAYQLNGVKKKEIAEFAQGIAVVHLYGRDLSKLNLSLPSLEEQRKIADFLSLIDERIETQRQTIEERKKQKKALLHQIFSQSLRFPDFSDPWQQTTLGEVAERVVRKNHNNESNRPLTISAQYGLIDQRDFFKKVIASNNLEGYYLLHQGEFAYNRSSSADYPWGAIKRLEKYSQGVLSTLYICFRITKGNPLFFTYLFDAFKWHSYVQSISAEGARNHGLLNIAVSDFFDMPISLPSLEEQRKIAELLAIFDERIEAEEALLKCYEAQKRYLLRQMFV